MNLNDKNLTKNEKRAQAREQARVAREASVKREKRKRFLIKGSVVLGVIAVLTTVALVVTFSLQPGAIAAPQNMATGGTIFTKDLKVKETGKLNEDGTFKATEFDASKRPVSVRVFADFMCPVCGSFESTYGKMLEQYTGSGDIEMEFYVLNFLDSFSSGTKYSSRSANAFACVVNEQPDKAYAYQKKLLEVQPKEGTAGLTDQQLLDYAIEIGTEKTPELLDCINKRTFVNFIDKATKQVLQEGVLGLAEGEVLTVPRGEPRPADQPQRISSTPTVIVNGKQWIQQRDGDLEQYLLKILQKLDSSEQE
ncbi:thioredoxin domain-containing protein [Canibacter sp. lx-72]|uniref:DsbA family protein n=1 Tax=Canibacter zhuwentaonis TaxID=2837491 RepID=UPI001BDD45F4|nr:thioredoxin domain-containing protein [Canibacter zhuwentaonis]MBT1018590.1 thioredoxin domain-containing protein [Canibacter zhuwentaonis]